jgi:hypothetical protein
MWGAIAKSDLGIAFWDVGCDSEKRPRNRFLGCVGVRSLVWKCGVRSRLGMWRRCDRLLGVFGDAIAKSDLGIAVWGFGDAIAKSDLGIAVLGCGSAIAKSDLGIAFGEWGCDSEALRRNRCFRGVGVRSLLGDVGSAIAILWMWVRWVRCDRVTVGRNFV